MRNIDVNSNNNYCWIEKRKFIIERETRVNDQITYKISIG